MNSVESGRTAVAWRAGPVSLRTRIVDAAARLMVTAIGHLVHDRKRLLAVADRLVSHGRFADAAALADLVRRRTPFDGKLHLHLAEAALLRGDKAGAAELIDRLAIARRGISRSAGLLLEVIGTVEAPRGYGVIFLNRQDRLPTPLPRMRLAEVIAAQAGWAATNGSSAAGRYQVIDRTLITISAELGLDPQSRYDAPLQDRIGHGLLTRRGFERFIARDLSLAAFALELAQEWAAFPVLAQVEGAHRVLEPGETFYAGDGRNRALMSPILFAAILERCRALAPHPEQPN